MKAQDRDYSFLEGTEITVENAWGNLEIAVVTGCDYYVGISLEYLDKPGTYWLCLNGPSAKEFLKRCKRNYPARFFSTVHQLRRGICEGKFVEMLENPNKQHAGLMSPCAFI